MQSTTFRRTTKPTSPSLNRTERRKMGTDAHMREQGFRRPTTAERARFSKHLRDEPKGRVWAAASSMANSVMWLLRKVDFRRRSTAGRKTG
jgi:hypothetical protein